MTLPTSSPSRAAMPAATPPARALNIDGLLEHMITLDASDLYLTANQPPVFRVNGKGLAAKGALGPEQVEALVMSLLDAAQREQFARDLELNLAVARAGGRFRVNVFRQRGMVGMVARLVRTKIRTADELGLPPVVKSVAMSARGLVLVVGATGSGKSTLLAAMIDHRNASQAGHILTIEDPVEFLHTQKQSIITQREVGADTHSYSAALKNALRQAPDVVLIGEIRDLETMEAAVGFAETGHLCISTLHANNANQAIERVLNFFPPGRQNEIRLQLSLNLRAIISQRLAPAVGGGRVPALEILLDTPRIKELVKRGEIDSLKDAMVQSTPEGGRTFDQSLLELLVAGKITEQDALALADSANDVRLGIERLRGGRGPGREPALKLLADPARPRT